MRTSELWQNVSLDPPDGIFALKDRCDNDTFPQKIDLSVGAYRGEDAKPWILPAVRKASCIDRRIHFMSLIHAALCGS